MLRLLLAASVLVVAAMGVAPSREALPTPARGAVLQAGAIRKRLSLTAWHAAARDGGVLLTTTRWTRPGEGVLAGRFSMSALPSRTDAGTWRRESIEERLLPEGLDCEARVESVYRGKVTLGVAPDPDAPEMARYVGLGKFKRTRLFFCSLVPDAGWDEPVLAPGDGVIELSFNDDSTWGDVMWVMPPDL